MLWLVLALSLSPGVTGRPTTDIKPALPQDKVHLADGVIGIPPRNSGLVADGVIGIPPRNTVGLSAMAV
jgi:hypothetical protein